MTREFDELSALTPYSRSLPFSEYFGEMDLSEEEKQKRIEAAEDLDDFLMYLFALITLMAASGSVDKNYIALQIKERYTAVVGRYMVVDEYLDSYILDFTDTFIQTTFDSIDDEWYLSADRARFIAENESNNVFSHDEYIKAVRDGKTQKRWITMRDTRVRHSHKLLDNKTLDISEQFVVGNSLMNFPRDESYTPNPSQVIACRCSIKYF